MTNDTPHVSIFKVLSAILHLGNITFKKHNNLRTSEECVVIADKEVKYRPAIRTIV